VADDLGIRKRVSAELRDLLTQVVVFVVRARLEACSLSPEGEPADPRPT
jgi:hypothetical protein